MISTEETIKRLREGNSRFVSDSSIFNKMISHKSRYHALTEDQDPFAIILGAEYSLDTDIVYFFDGLPLNSQ